MMIDRTPLPSAVKGGKEILTEKVRSEINALNGARPRQFLFQLLYAWVVIVIAIGWAVYARHWAVSALAIIVVATRHNVLGLLVHEQAHRLGFVGRFGDLFVNLFAAYPLLVLSVEGYARVHLAHHKFYFGDKDPDYLRKSGPQWSFPNSRSHLFKLFLTDILGINTLRLIKGKRESTPDYAFRRPFPTPRWIRPLYYLLVAAVLSVTHCWDILLLYWLLPIVSVSQVIVRWGAICEHKYNLPGASVEESTPLIIPSWLDKILLPNLNFSMHPYHHYFPGIAFCNLPKVHAIYQREGLLHEGHIFRGYRSYYRYLTAAA
jgi:fatty acid desaturase